MDEIIGARANVEITVKISDTEFRLVRDGLECRVHMPDGTITTWDSVNTDRDPDAYEQVAFDALESMHAEL